MLPLKMLLQNRYQITRLIGRGGMGAVYEAADLRLGHTVAVKQTLGGDPQEFEQEAQLLARLRHPALPHVLDHFVEETGQFLVMEYVPGDDLATMLLRQRRQPFMPEQVLGWADALLAALEYLHSREPPVIHRDIKPANLKLTADGQLVLLDFGLAKGKPGASASLLPLAAITNETDQPLINSPSIPGYTRHYAAPEQVRGAGTDARSDLYAVGATLYALLTGTPPPDVNQRASTLDAGQSDPLLPLHLQNPAVSFLISEVACRALALDPAGRFDSAQTMRRALQAAARTNLPVPPTPLLGRAQEMALIDQWLRRTDIRLVTLTGPGGIGKTRLSQAAAGSLLDAFPDGVFFVALAAIRDPGLVIPTIAQTLGIREEGGDSLQERLHEHLRQQRVLLILDNFEQIIAATAVVADLLATCPHLKILATSRAVLRLRGEHEFPVSELALPNLARLPSLATLAQVAAIALFVQRAQAVKPAFVLDTANAAVVAEICTRLDGLPLALELAAARSKLLSPPAMLARLTADTDARFKLLRDGARDLPDRQRTLQAAIDWSHDLLDPGEQMLFRRLAVFVGGGTLEAIEAICNPAGEQIPPPLPVDALDGLGSLLDKSLLRQDALAAEPRFTMLTTLHEYAAQRLAASGELAALRRRHAGYYLALAEAAEQKLSGPEQAAWFNRLEAEHNNLRAALHWAEEQDPDETGLRLAGALRRFWQAHGHLTDGRQRIEALLNKATTPSAIRAKALNTAGILAHLQGDLAAARRFHEASLAIRRTLALESDIAGSHNNLGLLAKEEGDQVTARRHFEEALVIWRMSGTEYQVAMSLMNLATVMLRQSEYGAARLRIEESLSTFRTLGDTHAVVNALINLSVAALRQNDFNAASRAAEEGLALAQQLGDAGNSAICMLNLANVCYAQGNYPAARHWLTESMAVLQPLGDKISLAYALEGFANLAAAEGEPVRAVRLFATAARLRSEIGAPLPASGQAEYEQSMERVRQVLTEDQISKAWAEGEAMMLEEAILYVLGTAESSGTLARR